MKVGRKVPLVLASSETIAPSGSSAPIARARIGNVSVVLVPGVDRGHEGAGSQRNRRARPDPEPRGRESAGPRRSPRDARRRRRRRRQGTHFHVRSTFDPHGLLLHGAVCPQRHRVIPDARPAARSEFHRRPVDLGAAVARRRARDPHAPGTTRKAIARFAEERGIQWPVRRPLDEHHPEHGIIDPEGRSQRERERRLVRHERVGVSKLRGRDGVLADVVRDRGAVVGRARARDPVDSLRSRRAVRRQQQSGTRGQCCRKTSREHGATLPRVPWAYPPRFGPVCFARRRPR